MDLLWKCLVLIVFVDLASQLSKDYSHIHHVISGKTQPSIKLARAIEHATGGKIKWQEFFPEPKKARWSLA